MTIFQDLPMDMVFKILSYDDRFILRKGELIDRISKKDKRYEVLKTIPEKQVDPFDDVIYVYLFINGDKDYVLSLDNMFDEGITKPKLIFRTDVFEYNNETPTINILFHEFRYM
jgi:hypothetical protein